MSQMPSFDMNNAIAEVMTDITKEGFTKKVIEKQMKKTIEDIVEESLRSWGDFGKALREQVQQQLQINLSKLDLPGYNELILQTIKNELDRSIHDQGVAKMQEQLQELLGTRQESINFSEIIKEMVEDEMNLEGLDIEECKEISVHIDGGHASVLTFINLDPEPDKENYECKYRIVLDSDGSVRSAEIRDQKFDQKVIMGGLYGMEGTLFKLYTHGSKIIIDDYETVFSNPNFD